MSYKLTYFDMAGRGEPIRLLLSVGGVKFEDVRINFGEWPTLKSKYPGGKLPLLECGDKKLTQSRAIFRHLGRTFKLTGNDDWEAARCDEIVDSLEDVFNGYIDYHWHEQDPAKKEEKKKVFIGTTLPAFLAHVNKVQTENGGTWLIGKNMTWADIVVAEYLRQLSVIVEKPNLVNEYPQVKKLQEAVAAVPNIKAFNRSTGM